MSASATARSPSSSLPIVGGSVGLPDAPPLPDVPPAPSLTPRPPVGPGTLDTNSLRPSPGTSVGASTCPSTQPSIGDVTRVSSSLMQADAARLLRSQPIPRCVLAVPNRIRRIRCAEANVRPRGIRLSEDAQESEERGVRLAQGLRNGDLEPQVVRRSASTSSKLVARERHGSVPQEA